MFRKTYPALLIIPALLPLCLFILFPAINTLYMSFHKVTYGASDLFVGIKNYTKLLDSNVFKLALVHTITYSIAIVILEISFSLGVSLLINTKFPFKKVIVSLIMMPYAVSEVVAVIIFQLLFSTDTGIVNYLISFVSQSMGKISWFTNPKLLWVVIVLIQIWISYPFSFLLIYSALICIPQELYEAASIDGAGKIAMFRYIILPTIRPVLLLATSFRLIFAFREFSTVWILTKGGPANATELLSSLLYKQAFQYNEFGLASATSIVMLIITIVLSLSYFSLMFKKEKKGI